MPRVIFHVDVNSAFLSWSAVKKLKEDPTSVDLRTIPSVVGGDVKTRHGIVTAKSIPAKKYGIQTAEPIASAMKKCPRLVVVSSDFHTYREYSHAFIDILRSYSDVLEQVSIDEAYVDVTSLSNMDLFSHLKNAIPGFATQANSSSVISELNLPYPLNVASAIRYEIRSTLGFTVNVGISSNKLLAKMASDFTKPDRTHTLYPDEVENKMWPLDIGDLYGCGKKTSNKLRSFGIRTIGDAAKYDTVLLKNQLGEKSGEYISLAANGIGSDIVNPVHEDAKSYSNETTTSSDITSENYDSDMPPIVKRLSESVSRRMKRDNVFGGTVNISVKTSDFKRYSRQMKISDSTNDADIIYENAMYLLSNLLTGENGLFEDGIHVRLVGVGLDHLDDGSYHQETLFDWMTTGQEAIKKEKAKEEKSQKLTAMEKLIKNKYGDNAIQKGI